MRCRIAVVFCRAIGLWVGLGLLGLGRAHAETNVWKHHTGNWEQNGGWVGGTPTPSSEAFITNGGTVQLRAILPSRDGIGVASRLVIDDGALHIGGETTGTLTIAGAITVGATAPGTLTLSSNSFLTVNSLIFGSQATYDDLPGSRITLSGGTSTVSVANNILIQSSVNGTAGLLKTGAGTLTLTANNSWLETVVDAGTLVISGGGTTSNSMAIIGDQASGAAAQVQGAGSLWQLGGHLVVGAAGSNNTLAIQDGGSVRNVGATIGQNSSQNSVRVSGPGSQWLSSGILIVGSNSTQNSLLASNGATVESAAGCLGYAPGADQNTALVDAGRWSNAGELVVGYAAANNRLVVQNGGTLSSALGQVGVYCTANVAVVDGGTWNNTGEFQVGVYACANSLILSNGGTVLSGNAQIGVAAEAGNNRGLVVGDGSTWRNSGTLTVGVAGSDNSVIVQAGASLSASNGVIGLSGHRNRVLVTDAGSVWRNDDTLVLGLAGSDNTLILTNGGQLFAANLLVGAEASASNNLLSLSQASLVLTNGTGRLELRRGTLLTQGSHLLLNQLLVSPTATYTDTADGLISLVGPDAHIEIQGGTTTVHSQISGTNGLTKTGGGELVLTKANIYSGNTWILGGTVAVKNSDALGTGDVHLVGGLLKADPLQINVHGNYTQSVDGTLELAVGGVIPSQFDWLNISGAASLTGTLRTVQFNGYVPLYNQSQVLLLAGEGRTGQFGTLDSQIPHSPLLNPTLDYGTGTVTLRWQQLSFVPYALTRNQAAVAGGLDQLTNANTESAINLLNYLDYLPGGTNALPPAFDLIAPEEFSALFQSALGGLEARGQSLRNRSAELRAGLRGFSSRRLSLRQDGQGVPQPDGSVLLPGDDQGLWGLYLEGLAEYTGLEADHQARGYHLNTRGLTLGLDRRLNQHLVLGATAGYDHSTADLVNDGQLRADSALGSLYGVWFNQGWHLQAMIGGGLNGFDAKRTALGGTARGDAEVYEITGLLGGGYDWQRGIWSFGPQVALQYDWARLNQFREKGSMVPLTYPEQEQDSLYSDLGLHLGCQTRCGKVQIAPMLSLAWRHEYLHDGLRVAARLADGTEAFTVSGPDVAADSVLVNVGLGIGWTPRLSTYLNYQTELGRDNYQPHTVSGGVRLSF